MFGKEDGNETIRAGSSRDVNPGVSTVELSHVKPHRRYGRDLDLRAPGRSLSEYVGHETITVARMGRRARRLAIRSPATR